jgi:16S rRNA U516 pseudouridylate synthase RsuA-like enzyme
MFASRGRTVMSLHRQQVGRLKLDGGLRPGEYRELTPDERADIFAD